MPELFPFEPDWERSFRVEHSYKTEIITSYGRQEQRIALRQFPRKSIEYEVKLTRGGLAEFQAYMAKKQQGAFWVPDWSRWASPNAVMAIGTDTLFVDDVPGWVKPGQQMYLKEGAVALLFEIASVAVGMIQFTTTAPIEFTTKLRAYCVYEATINQKTKARLLTNTAGQSTLNFTVKPGSVQESEPPAPEVFNGRELFLTKMDWSSSPSVDLEGYLESVDFDIGITDHNALTLFNRRYSQQGFWFKKDRMEDFLAFFRRCRAQRGEFYAPTWEPDIDFSLGAAVATSTLDIYGSTFFDLYGGSTVYKALIVFYKDGTHEAKQITGTGVVLGNSRITVATPWAKAINAANVRMISLLPVWRFSTDDMTVDWTTNTVAQVQTTFCTLEDL